jgi:hypothetical protein
MPRQVAVMSSIAEAHYGVTSTSVWQEVVDRGQPKNWDRLEGNYKVDKMTWFINKVRSQSAVGFEA